MFKLLLLSDFRLSPTPFYGISKPIVPTNNFQKIILIVFVKIFQLRHKMSVVLKNPTHPKKKKIKGIYLENTRSSMVPITSSSEENLHYTFS